MPLAFVTASFSPIKTNAPIVGFPSSVLSLPVTLWATVKQMLKVQKKMTNTNLLRPIIVVDSHFDAKIVLLLIIHMNFSY